MGKTGTPGHNFTPGKFICTQCQQGRCVQCIDLKRVAYTREKICECPKHKTAASVTAR